MRKHATGIHNTPETVINFVFILFICGICIFLSLDIFVLFFPQKPRFTEQFDIPSNRKNWRLGKIENLVQNQSF